MLPAKTLVFAFALCLLVGSCNSDSLTAHQQLRCCRAPCSATAVQQTDCKANTTVWAGSMVVTFLVVVLLIGYV